MAGYDFTAIERKWQAYWAEHQTFRQPNPGAEGFIDRPKRYVLDMFPYPSGAGLHVGHPEGYTATDIVCRYWRMRGFNVLHPMGYDAFGLPAEQYAVEHGVHPRVTTEQNIANIERQIRMFGFSYDWSRRLATTDVGYYCWTQWIFLQMFHSWYDPDADAARPISELVQKLESGQYVIDVAGRPVVNVCDGMSPLFGDMIGTHKWHELPPAQRRAILDDHRLAYMDEVPVNWCPKLGTVLANEEVTNEGRSERGDHPVYRRALKQWMLRITAYAERLDRDLELLDWPEPIKIMQRNWIGRSRGAEVDFPLAGGPDAARPEWFEHRRESGYPPVEEEDVIRVYTTRPDTLYGATYMVLAPEHPLVRRITAPQQRAAVQAYVARAASKSELERTAETKDKTGVFTGAYAVNPVNRQPIPVWAADYVLMGYGTGAIMAVPAHDTRDFEFAEAFDLPIVTVVLPDRTTALSVPIPTWYSYDGDIGNEVSQEEWDAIADSIRREFRRNSVLYAGKPDGSILVMDRGGRRVCLLPDRELRPLWGDVDVQVIRRFASMLRNRAREHYESFTGDGTAVNSGEYDGLETSEFIRRISEDLARQGLGKATVNYKLRDWLFSRQRYWGEPFPIVHCASCGTVGLPEDELPLVLPEMEDFTPDASEDPTAPPKPPLGKMTDWTRATCPECGGPATRELNTMPQWAGSCWYYLRYLDPDNDRHFCDVQVERYWMGPSKEAVAGGVDLYVGGSEHAVLHLLYARFWHKVLHDLGHVSSPEPFRELFNQGMIRSFAYRDGRGVYVGYDDVEHRDDGPVHRQTGERLVESVEKMSKSLRNVVNPDDVVAEYGADTFRLYEMFMGPLEASKPWNTQDVPGVHRFLHRVWRMACGDPEQGIAPLLADAPGDEGVEKALHRLIRKVGEDVEAMKFNTAIAAMMEFVNAVYKAGRIARDQAERFVLVLAPFAPHVAEELWQRLGHGESLAHEPWPAHDEKLVAEKTIDMPVQVNGKVRARISVPADADQDAVIDAALAHQRIAELTAGKTLVKKVVVPNRLVNLVVK